jgi:hypothetical protein
MTVLDVRKYRIIQHVLAMTQEEKIADVEQSVGLPAFDFSSAVTISPSDSTDAESLPTNLVEEEETAPNEKRERYWEAVKPIRKAVPLKQLLEEQNYKPIDREEFFKKAAELNIEEPLEDLLAMLTP